MTETHVVEDRTRALDWAGAMGGDLDPECRDAEGIPGDWRQYTAAQRAALTAFIVSKVQAFGFGGRRGWQETAAAGVLGVTYRSLRRWRLDEHALRMAVEYRGADFAERLACLLAAPPFDPVPAVPLTVRYAHRAGGVPQLEMSATYDATTTLEAWAERVFPMLTISRTGVRLTVRGKVENLRAMRDAIMGVERWATLTPTTADVTRWIGGAP